MKEINVYCDETCHLENDGYSTMGLGAIWLKKEKIREVNQRIREIKENHNIPREKELKWTGVSPSFYNVYKDLVNYFFSDDDLNFRVLIVPDKTKLNHCKYNQTHDDWYYKMYFTMLKNIFISKFRYYIYIDIKDDYSSQKAKFLNEVICNAKYDFNHDIIRRIQPIRSDEVEIMQLVDILVGAVCYYNRIFPEGQILSRAKQDLVSLIKSKSGKRLTSSTYQREDKFNIFIWEPNYYD